MSMILSLLASSRLILQSIPILIPVHRHILTVRLVRETRASSFSHYLVSINVDICQTFFQTTVSFTYKLLLPTLSKDTQHSLMD